MTITSQQLRELPNPADLWLAEDGRKLLLEAARLLLNNREALLTALELQERLDKPETAEVVARALCSDDPNIRMGDAEPIVQQRVTSEWKRYMRTAQAAINALKGGAQ